MRTRSALTNHWLYSLEPPAIGVISLALALWLKFTILFWVVPLFIFIILPIMDYRSRDDRHNPDRIAARLKPHRGFFQWIARSYMPIQYLMNALAVGCFIECAPSAFNTIGLILSIGIVNGIAIAPAHELNHASSSFLNRLFSVLISAPAFYGQFLVEHNVGHHVKVATPEDPASARLGESFWAFGVRSIIMGFISAARYEVNRFRTSARNILNSKLLQGWLCSALLVWATYLVGGASAVGFYVAQAVVGMFLLEVVNYIEHYGLLREKINGEYAPCTPQHSWNSNKLVSNIGLFNLQRHSDHHANPMRPYEMLRHIPDSPQHPTGYAAMIVLALIPPLWFRVMDPRVVALYGGDVCKANLHPRKAEKLKRRFQLR